MSNFAPDFGVFAQVCLCKVRIVNIIITTFIKLKTKQNDHCTRKRRREHRARAEEV